MNNQQQVLERNSKTLWQGALYFLQRFVMLILLTVGMLAVQPIQRAWLQIMLIVSVLLAWVLGSARLMARSVQCLAFVAGTVAGLTLLLLVQEAHAQSQTYPAFGVVDRFGFPTNDTMILPVTPDDTARTVFFRIKGDIGRSLGAANNESISITVEGMPTYNYRSQTGQDCALETFSLQIPASTYAQASANGSLKIKIAWNYFVNSDCNNLPEFPDYTGPDNPILIVEPTLIETASGIGVDGLVSAQSTSLVSDGVSSTTVTFQATDRDGNNISTGGQEVVFSVEALPRDSTFTTGRAPDEGTFGPVQDNGNGTYTAIYTVGSSTGNGRNANSNKPRVVIGAKVDGVAANGTATIFLDAGPADPNSSTFFYDDGSSDRLADGAKGYRFAVQLNDALGNPVLRTGDNVTFTTTIGTLSNGGVPSFNNDETTYSINLTSTQPGSGEVRAFVDGQEIGTPLAVTFTPIPVDISQSTIDADPGSVPADGASESTITVQLKDAAGQNLIHSNGTIQLFTDFGTLLGSVVDNNDGTYSQQLQAPSTAQNATITGTLDGNPLPSTAIVEFYDTQAPTIAVTSDKTALTANETAVITFTLSDVSTDFQAEDVTVTGGTISTPLSGVGSSYTATFTPDSDFDGEATVSVASNRFSNSVGLLNGDGGEQDNTVKIAVDTLAPAGYTVRVDQDPVNTTNQTAVSFYFARAEVGAQYAYIFTSDGGGEVGPFTGTVNIANERIPDIDLSSLGDGLVELSVKLTDPGGSVSDPVTDTTTKDTETPTFSVALNDLTPTNASNVVFLVEFSEDVRNVNASDFELVTMGSADGDSTVSVVRNTASEYTVTVTNVVGAGTLGLGLSSAQNITDLNGNVLDTAPTSNEEYEIDRIAPTVTIDELATNDRTPELTGTVDDAAARITVEVNGQSVTATNNGTTWTLADNTLATLDAGVYDVAVTATDNVGNVGADTTTSELTIDTNVPSGYTVRIDQDPINTNNQTKVSFFFSNTEVGTQYEYIFTSDDGSSVGPFSDTVTAVFQRLTDIDLSTLGDGMVTLSMTLTDSAGNVGDPATDMTTKDTTAPTVSSVTPNPTTVGTSGPLEIVIQFSESMDITQTPALSFGSDVASVLQTAASQIGSWSSSANNNNDTYTVSYQVTDAGVNIPDIDVIVGTSFKDANGVPLVEHIQTDVFSIEQDTTAPTLVVTNPTVGGGTAGVSLGDSVSTSDTDVATWEWVQVSSDDLNSAVEVSGLTLTNPNSKDASFDAPDVATNTPYYFKVTATDANSNAASKIVTVTVTDNTVPMVKITNNGPKKGDETGELDGSGSSDSGSGIDFYSWKQVDGSDSDKAATSNVVTLSNASAAMTTFTVPDAAANTTLYFKLTVTDKAGNAASKWTEYVVTENTAPMVKITNNGPKKGDETGELDGSGSSDSGSGIDFYSWKQVDGPGSDKAATSNVVTLSNASAAMTTFTVPDAATNTTLYFKLTVTDKAGNAASKWTEYVVTENTAPMVSSVTPSPNPIIDTTSTFQIEVVFSESMDSSQTPALGFGSALGGVLPTDTRGSWSKKNYDNDTYTVTYQVTDKGLNIPDIDVIVGTSFLDANGNALVEYRANNAFYIEQDTMAPRVLSVTPSPNPIIDTTNEFQIKVVFSESMDSSRTPVLSFNPDVSSVLPIATLGSWSTTTNNNDTYTVIYQVTNAGVNIPDIGVIVGTSFLDANGNALVEYTKDNVFSIEQDTMAPTVSSVTPSPNPIIDTTSTFQIEVVFSESMDSSQTPALGFSSALGGVLPTDTRGSWSKKDYDNDTYTVTYTVTDAGVNIPDIDVIVGTSFKDANGIPLVEYIQTDVFSIEQDLIAPTGYSVKIDEKPINSKNADKVSFTITGAEVGSKYEYTFKSDGDDGLAVTGTGMVGAADEKIKDIDLSGLPDGKVTLSVTLTDIYNNVGGAAKDEAMKDTIGPSGYSVKIDQESINSKNADKVSFTITGAEADATYWYIFESSGGGTPVQNSGPINNNSEQVTNINLSQLNDGTITLLVYLSDKNGNEGPLIADFVSKDTVSPTVVVTSDVIDTLGGPNATAKITFDFDEKVEPDTFDPNKIIVEGGLLSAPIAHPTDTTILLATFTPTPNSVTGGKINVQNDAFFDSAGNGLSDGNDADNITSFKIDTLPPVFSSVHRFNPSEQTTSADELTFVVTFDEPVKDPATSDFILKDSAGLVASGTVRKVAVDPDSPGGKAWLVTVINVQGDGEVVLALSPSQAIKDKLGNLLTDTSQPSDYETYILDNTAPVVTVDLLTTNNKTPELTGKVNDPNATIEVRVGNETIAGNNSGTGTWSATVPTALPDGTYNVIVTAEDSVGNKGTDNSQDELTIDTTAPTLTISSSDDVLKIGETATITFTFSEEVSGFAFEDINVLGGQLDNFASDLNNTNIYTAIFKPTPNFEGPGKISVADGAYTDTLSNPGNGDSRDLTVDTLAPVVTVDLLTTNNKTPELTGTVDDQNATIVVIVNNQTITGNNSGTGTWSATVTTPLPDGTYNVMVTAEDSVGNKGTDSSQDELTIDATAPTLTISSSDDVLKIGETATITFTFSEEVSGFALEDINVLGGQLDNFASDLNNTNIYTAIFKPTPNFEGPGKISVADGAYTDGVGNSGAGYILDLTVDTLAPTLTISSSDTELTIGETATITFTFSQEVSGFAFEDITVSNGVLENFAAGNSNDTYAATFTPTSNFEGPAMISVADADYTDLLGNPGDGDSLELTVDTLAPTLDPVSITSSNATSTLATVGDIITLSFTANEVLGETPDVLIAGEVASVTNTSGNDYEATYIVDANTPSGLVSFLISGLEDAAGNPGADVFAVTDNSSVTVDSAAPTVEILDAPESIGDLTPFAIRVVFSEEVMGFELADITVGNGSASNLTTSDNISFAADITPDGSGDITLDVLAGAAQDLAGNDNIAAEQVVIENKIVEITKQVIANFMLNRANFLLGNQPDISGLLGGTHGNGGGPLGALAFTGNESGMDLAFATSLSKIDRERQRAIEQRVAEAHQFADSSTSETSLMGVYGADIIPSGVENAAIIAPTQSDSNPYGSVPTRRYDIWTEVYGATSTAGDSESEYWVGYLGGHYFVSENLIIGGLVQLDWSEEEDSVAGSAADGFGWMVGPYMAGTVPDTTLSWDLRAAWGRSNNSVNPIGIYTDDFETERWLVSGKVQGSFNINELIVTPTLQGSWFEETQQAYTDSLGNLITEQTISLGEIKFGPEFAMNKVLENGMVVSPSVAISGVWNFGLRDNESSQGYVLGDEEVRARIDLGIDLRDPQGRSLAVSGYYDGLGIEDYEAMGGEIRLSVPFQ